MCIRVDDENQIHPINIKIPLTNYVSQRDVWLHHQQQVKANLETEVYQTIHVTT